MDIQRQYLSRAPELLGYTETRREPMSIVKGFAAELFGTLFVVLLWTAVTLGAARSDEFSIVGLAITIGFIVAAMIWVFGCASGGHLNPCVTFGLMFTGIISPFKAVLFIAAQCIGGIIGAGILYGLTLGVTDENGVGFNITVTTPHAQVTSGQALSVETIVASIVVLAAMVSKDENQEELRFLGPLAIGFSMTSSYLAFAFYTTPSMNPARSLGPAVISGIWSHHWVYWVGPFLGAFIAALLYLGVCKAPTPDPLRDLVEVQSQPQPHPDHEDDHGHMVDIPLEPRFEPLSERRPTGIPGFDPVANAAVISPDFLDEEEITGEMILEHTSTGSGEFGMHKRENLV